MSSSHLRVTDALARLEGQTQRRFVELFGHGTLLVELYAPRGHDPLEAFTDDFATWVMFYGPKGGETDARLHASEAPADASA